MDYSTIKIQAERIRWLLGFTGRVIPIIDAANAIGLSVLETNLRVVTAITDISRQTIYVSKSISTEKKRFAIAHQIGHWVLHPKDCEDLAILDNTKDNTRNPLKREAAYFAKCLLIPLSEWDQSDCSFEELGKAFAVEPCLFYSMY